MPDRHWEDLPATVRLAIESHIGPVRAARSASTGSVSSLAATLDTDGGRIFCKAIQTSNPLARMHHAEARVNPWLPDIAPRLRWKIEESDWLALGFDHVPGRHADLTPGSIDLPVIADTLTALTQGLTPCPPVRVQAATKRWEGLIAPELVDGETLLHTDVTPFNFLVDTRVHVVDWSMPCRGAAWIDTALMIVRLVRAGHSPADSEEWADQIPAWKQAAPDAVDAFAAALADLWEQRRQESPAPHRGPLAVAARSWASHRGASA
ncbi:phosphotransferase [Micromonospora wenchangensis]|uniref:phosphotransferase n=1 Tax=Micromonospora wenchangensis TaxID=1185415 RepID=UPI003D750161